MSQSTLGSTPYRNSDLFSGYYLQERVDDLDAWDCDEEAEAVFEELRELWAGEGDLVSGYNEDTLLGSWIDPVLDALGYDTMQETPLPDTGGYIDRVLYPDAAARQDAAMMKQDGQISGAFGRASALLEAKQWDTDFTQRFSEQRSYRDASHQVKYYLEHTPESLQWGILTDGKKWRLYGTKDYATETYYEVDLPEILASGDLEEFKYFYLFFRPEAFREVAGSTFLETVWSESETAAQELGEDLQDNVFTALRVLGEGFVETNDLDIDPGDEAALAELKEQSLVLLYRLMFVLYAESRHLIDPDDPNRRAEYRENFSLDEIRLRIHDRIEDGEGFDSYSEYSRSIWSQLQDLFRLVDSGEESLGVSAYNGGLFDRDQHEFLAEHEVSDRYIAEVIYRLGTTETADGSFALADYADLDTRHLGTIYEGLLEHEFRIAPEEYAAVAEDGGQVWKPATEVSVADSVEDVEKGELYVVNDEGERKATGAYYTPDYVVSYIVEETVDPLIEELEADLDERGLERGTQEYVVAFWNGVTDLRVLDPAMGSGHFLTSATEYLASAVMERVRELETATLFDEQQIRREISRECIYGVDLNGMAVELAKLSMWLETLATDQPLAFLDHHLKAGNSLVGSDISEVLGTDEPSGTEQATLFDDFSRTRRQALEHVMDLVEDLLAIDNETVEDAKAMEDLYEEIREDDLYERLFGMANVHTAERFDLDVPDGAYKQMANAIDDEAAWAAIEDDEDWYATAQAMAEDEQFFHWELEYPEVFFSTDGERSESAGFDAVVGNPPWLRFQRIPEKQRSYQRSQYRSAVSKYDVYAPFIERALSTLGPDGRLGYIIQNRFLAADYGESLKRVMVNESSVDKILDFEDAPIFGNTTTYPLITILSKSDMDDFGYTHLQNANESDVRQSLNNRAAEENRLDSDVLDPSDAWIFPSVEERELIEQLEGSSNHTFSDIIEISKSVSTNLKEAYLLGPEEALSIEDELIAPAVDGEDIEKYGVVHTGKQLLFPYEWHSDGPVLVNISEYPNAEAHLREYEEQLRNRRYYNKSLEEAGLEWYEYPHVKDNHNQPKILFPDISTEARCTFDTVGDVLSLTTAYGGVRSESDLDVRYISALFNSSPVSMVFEQTSPQMSGGYYRYQPQYIGELPLYCPEIESYIVSEDKIEEFRGSELDGSPSDDALYKRSIAATEEIREAKKRLSSLNLSLLDHLGAYDDGQTLADIGLTQPPENAADSVLQQTAEEKPNLRVGDCDVIRESSSTVEIRLTARYKPEDDDDFETDQWGYTETEPLPALRITDLAETEADLIAAFVPVAVDEAGGFAGFRETATKTNSLVDRLRGLTLPRVDDVAAGLESYVETKERADELDAKIQRTDDLIDEIVYELYGLTDEEIEIVEESVN